MAEKQCNLVKNGGGMDLQELLTKLSIEKDFSIGITDNNISFYWKNSANAEMQLSFFYDISSNTRVTMSKDYVRQWQINS